LRRALRSRWSVRCCMAAWIAITLLVPACGVQGQEVKVKYKAGAQQGFLVLHDLAGALLANGEITQMPYQDRIKLHLVLRFRDGSIDDETTVYSQRDTFHLISDRLVQTGKSFPSPCDVKVDVRAQLVSVRAMSKGKRVVTTQHFDLSPSLANGMLFALIQNLQPETGNVELPYLALQAKPRMVKLAIAQEGPEPFKIAGHSYKAMKYVVKVNIGGLAGIVAPMIGKQPADTYVWVTEGSVPGVVRVQGPLYAEGPVWNIQMASPTW
jgi:hypothetical protein